MSRSLGSGWREKLEGLGAEVWELPMSKIDLIQPKKSWVSIIERSDWLVFTRRKLILGPGFCSGNQCNFDV
jgi:uroporphyrinogen-III synthase